MSRIVPAASHVPRIALELFVLLLFVSTTAPSGVTTGDLPGGPADAHELALLSELAGWVDQDAISTPETPIRQRIHDEAESFAIFRSYPEGEARIAPVVRLPYGRSMEQAAAHHGVDPLLVAAIVSVESRFDANAISHRGAVGLMQVLPTTAGTTSDGLSDPQANLDAGVAYFGWLLSTFDGNLELALAAYNAGPTSVRRYGGVPPFGETEEYVEKVLRAYVELNRAAWLESEEAALVSRAG